MNRRPLRALRKNNKEEEAEQADDAEVEQRDASVPDIPTFREQGYDVVVAGSVKGVAVPKGTPKDVISYLDGKCRDISKDAEFASIMKQIAQPIDYQPAAEYTAWFKKAYDQYGMLLKTLNIETK